MSGPNPAHAERLVRESLAALGWSEEDLARRRKADGGKVKLAGLLRSQTPMTWAWIAQRLQMGSASYVARLLASARPARRALIPDCQH